MQANSQNYSYKNPLIERYASTEMQYIFSDFKKYTIWRKLWVALAKAQQNVGLPITTLQIEELESNVENINFSRVKELEQQLKHEVMAHVHAFAENCPNAGSILHLGETSAFVIDNTDIIIYKEALILIEKRLINVIQALSEFASQYKAMATLSFTHFQPAQPTTLGKRASNWLYSFLIDFYEILHVKDTLLLRGIKGTTGTAASFKELLNNNYEALKKIDRFLAQEFNFPNSYAVTSQIYDRKIDMLISQTLAGIGVSAHKITNDLRLLQHLKEIEEPFQKKQIGSSAMPYKRNPMLSERVAALAKFVMSLSNSTSLVAATQWLERTLDDSANKRLTLPQIFLAIDSILLLLHNIISGLEINEKIIAKNLKAEIPFMITENILMEYVKNGGSRQDGHSKIREHSINAAHFIKKTGGENNLIELIKQDKTLNIADEKWQELLNANTLVGFATEQVSDFLSIEVQPLLKKYNFLLNKSKSSRV